MVQLENENITVAIKSAGAELTRLYSKNTKLDYLWNADPKFWNRHAPILFPIVGKLKNLSYYIDEKKYDLPQHGFARDQEFSVYKQSKSAITFLLSSTEKSKEIYPYSFNLFVTYELIQNAIKITYKVENTDNQLIYFSIGAHPAFKCPLTNQTDFSDYYIAFEKEETPLQYSLNQENGLRISPPKQVKLPKKLALNYSLFEKDALIFKNISSKVISLKSTKHDHGLHFSAKNWEYFAFWTKKDAPFICFEPWMGAADLETTNQDFTTKDGIIELGVNKEFKQRYAIELF